VSGPTPSPLGSELALRSTTLGTTLLLEIRYISPVETRETDLVVEYDMGAQEIRYRLASLLLLKHAHGVLTIYTIEKYLSHFTYSR
jgi:hypothetical protein